MAGWGGGLFGCGDCYEVSECLGLTLCAPCGPGLIYMASTEPNADTCRRSYMVPTLCAATTCVSSAVPCAVNFYNFWYRTQLREKFAPGSTDTVADLTGHIFCAPCAMAQDLRAIRGTETAAGDGFHI